MIHCPNFTLLFLLLCCSSLSSIPGYTAFSHFRLFFLLFYLILFILISSHSLVKPPFNHGALEIVKPTEVKVSQLTQVLVADKEAVLECSTFGSRPKAVIYWNFDGQRFNTPLNGTVSTHTHTGSIPISAFSSLHPQESTIILPLLFSFFSHHPPPVINPSLFFLIFSSSILTLYFLFTVGALGEHQTSTTITITPKQEHNGAEITCIAENPKIPTSTISDHLILDVQC